MQASPQVTNHPTSATDLPTTGVLGSLYCIDFSLGNTYYAKEDPATTQCIVEVASSIPVGSIVIEFEPAPITGYLNTYYIKHQGNYLTIQDINLENVTFEQNSIGMSALSTNVFELSIEDDNGQLYYLISPAFSAPGNENQCVTVSDDEIGFNPVHTEYAVTSKEKDGTAKKQKWRYATAGTNNG